MNVTIIQEEVTTLGNVKFRKISNVMKVEPQDKVRLKGIENPRQYVIWCSLKDGKHFPIAYFPTPELRDKALNYILLSSSKVVVLDYNDFFCNEVIDDKIVKERLLNDNFTLVKALQYAIDWIKKSKPDQNIYELDAFCTLSKPAFNTITRLTVECPVLNPALPSLWAKTLKIDCSYLNDGFSKKQIFKSLININNEKFCSYRPI